jgi:hypothetical protein
MLLRVKAEYFARQKIFVNPVTFLYYILFGFVRQGWNNGQGNRMNKKYHIISNSYNFKNN